MSNRTLRSARIVHRHELAGEHLVGREAKDEGEVAIREVQGIRIERVVAVGIDPDAAAGPDGQLGPRVDREAGDEIAADAVVAGGPGARDIHWQEIDAQDRHVCSRRHAFERLGGVGLAVQDVAGRIDHAFIVDGERKTIVGQRLADVVGRVEHAVRSRQAEVQRDGGRREHRARSWRHRADDIHPLDRNDAVVVALDQVVARVGGVVEGGRSRIVTQDRLIEEREEPQRQIHHTDHEAVDVWRGAVRRRLRIEQVVHVAGAVDVHVGDLRTLRIDKDLQLLDEQQVVRVEVARHVFGRHVDRANAVLHREELGVVHVDRRGDLPPPVREGVRAVQRVSSRLADQLVLQLPLAGRLQSGDAVRLDIHPHHCVGFGRAPEGGRCVAGNVVGQRQREDRAARIAVGMQAVRVALLEAEEHRRMLVVHEQLHGLGELAIALGLVWLGGVDHFNFGPDEVAAVRCNGQIRQSSREREHKQAGAIHRIDRLGIARQHVVRRALVGRAALGDEHRHAEAIRHARHVERRRRHERDENGRIVGRRAARRLAIVRHVVEVGDAADVHHIRNADEDRRGLVGRVIVELRTAAVRRAIDLLDRDLTANLARGALGRMDVDIGIAGEQRGDVARDRGVRSVRQSQANAARLGRERRAEGEQIDHHRTGHARSADVNMRLGDIRLRRGERRGFDAADEQIEIKRVERGVVLEVGGAIRTHWRGGRGNFLGFVEDDQVVGQFQIDRHFGRQVDGRDVIDVDCVAQSLHPDVVCLTFDCRNPNGAHRR